MRVVLASSKSKAKPSTPASKGASPGASVSSTPALKLWGDQRIDAAPEEEEHAFMSVVLLESRLMAEQNAGASGANGQA